MPECKVCGTKVELRDDMTAIRGEDGRWIAVCDACSGKGTSASDDDTSTDQKRPKTAGNDGAENLVDSIRQVLEVLRSEREKGESAPGNPKREHERFEAELIVTYSLVRDDEQHKGRVRDISAGGMRFLTKRRLTRGQILHLAVDVPEDHPSRDMFGDTAEVRRVQELGNGVNEVGIRFVRRTRGKVPNRRLAKRFAARLAAYYQRPGSELTLKGLAEDISQSGACLILDEKVEKGEQLTVRLRGKVAPFLAADLCGQVGVVRVRQRGVSEYEVGCRLGKMKMEPRKGEA